MRPWWWMVRNKCSFSEETSRHDILQPWEEAVGVSSRVRVGKRQREEAGAWACHKWTWVSQCLLWTMRSLVRGSLGKRDSSGHTFWTTKEAFALWEDVNQNSEKRSCVGKACIWKRDLVLHLRAESWLYRCIRLLLSWIRTFKVLKLLRLPKLSRINIPRTRISSNAFFSLIFF